MADSTRSQGSISEGQTEAEPDTKNVLDASGNTKSVPADYVLDVGESFI